jgi:autotransporter-associated beta strand protein
MNIKHVLTALCIVAAASTARSQLATPLVSRVPAPAGGNGAAPYYPTQIQQAYGVSALQAAGSNNGGLGQTIAIIDPYHYPNALSALNTFSAGYLSGTNSAAVWTLPAMSSSGTSDVFTQLNQTGGTLLPTATSSSWAMEEALDIEYAHTMAPQANIILYQANSPNNSDLYAAISAAQNNPAVSVVSISWAAPEFAGETGYDSYYFTTPGTRGKNGVTFCAATGDYGDFNESPGSANIGYPAASPNVVAVGGTSLYLTTSSSYSSETAWNWNSANQWGGGGGTSTMEPKPSYQTGYGTAHPGNVLATTTSRAIPDVSMESDRNQGVWVYDPSNGGWNVLGGTSLAAPCFAGLVADADGIRVANGHTTLDGATQTLPALYRLSGDFHDITSGNISPTGNANYSATAGYDLATGLGSPIANQLVPDLANYGTSYTSLWAAAAGGNWSTWGNWTQGVPNSSGAAAAINVATTAQVTITLDEPAVLGSLLLGNSASSSAGYTLSGGGSNTLTFNNSGSGATITVAGGAHQINAPVVLSDNLLVAAAGTNSWTLSFGSAGGITDTGSGFSLTMSGTGGTLVLGASSTYRGTTTVNAGILKAGGPGALSSSSSFAVNGGTLDATWGPQTVKSLNVGTQGTLNLCATNLLTSSGSAHFNGSLNVLNFTGGTAELIAYGSTSGSFASVTGVSSSDRLAYASNQLDVVPKSSTTYNLAAAISSTLLHAGGTATVSAAITNAGSAQDDSLDFAGLTVTASSSTLGGGSLPMSGGPLALGASASGTAVYTAAVAGTFLLIPTATGGTNADLQTPAALGSATTASVAVFSGSGTWTGSSGTLWSAAGNWIDANGVHAAPGTFAGFSDTDMATFSGSGAATTISLSGANPSLCSLAMSGANYTLAGGTLTLNGGSGTATVSTGASQTIASALALATATDISPQAGSTLAISGNASGSGSITKLGAGKLVLSGTDTYQGGTTVLAGKLIVDESYSLANDSRLTVGNAALFGQPIPADEGAASTATAAPVPEPGTLASLAAAATVLAMRVAASRRGWHALSFKRRACLPH